MFQSLFLSFVCFVLAVWGLCRCAGFSLAAEAGAALIAVCASHCGGVSCCGARALGRTASVFVAHRLSSSVACGIFLDQGLNLYLLHWQADSSPLSHQGSPSKYLNNNNRKAVSFCPGGEGEGSTCWLSLHPCSQSTTAPALPSPSTWTAPSSLRSSSATISGIWWTRSGSLEPLGLRRTAPLSGNQPWWVVSASVVRST